MVLFFEVIISISIINIIIIIVITTIGIIIAGDNGGYCTSCCSHGWPDQFVGISVIRQFTGRPAQSDGD